MSEEDDHLPLRVKCIWMQTVDSCQVCDDYSTGFPSSRYLQNDSKF